METIKVNFGDVLICDPCYIKNAGTEYNGEIEPRFDLLKCEKVLHDGDDGMFSVEYDGKSFSLGVDSGRIWQMVAEFDGVVELDAGFSGFELIKADQEN